MTAIATHEPICGMAGVLNGPQHAQAPQRPGPLPSRVLHPDEQLRQNPFYAHSVQPFFSYQWPMSSLYLPYGGIHGLGYSMMPLLLPSCFEVPGYMIPQAQLHMLDYRCMTPHVTPTTTHQTCRSRFQNNVPFGRVMVSSEVQTEPLCHILDSHGPTARSDTCSESGRDTGCGSTASTSPRSFDHKSTGCTEVTSVLTQNYIATDAIDNADLSAVPKSEILQAEQVQIKCSEMPSERKSIQDKVNTDVASYNKTHLLQCSLGSVQSLEDVVMCSYRSLEFREDKQRVQAEMLRYSSKHRLSSCTEVNVVRTSPSCRTFKTYAKPTRSAVTQCVGAKRNSEMPFQTKGKEDGSSPDNIHFKILRLPFDIQNHNQPCQLEASIWSVESLFPYVPSSEWMTENGLLTPQRPLSPLIEPSDVSKPNCVPVGNPLQTGTSVKRQGLSHQLEASIWSVESLMPYVPSSEWMTENGFLTPQKPLNPHMKSSDVLSELNQSSTDGIPVGKNLQTGGSTKYNGLPCQLEASMWSVESLMPYVPSNECMLKKGLLTSQKHLSPQITPGNVPSEINQPSNGSVPVGKNLQTCASTKHENFLKTCSPYHPSTSWLADFGNVYYYSKLPVGWQQPDIPEEQLPNLSLAISLESSPLRNKSKTRNPRPAIGIPDQKNDLSRCKCKAQSSPRLAGSDMCGWVTNSTQEGKLPFCPSCRYDMKGKDHKKRSISSVLCCKSKDIAEVKTFDKKRANKVIHDAKKMILSECCAVSQPKLRGQPGLCDDCPCLHASPGQDECCDLGLRIWKKSDEDLINQKKTLLQRLQKDNEWKGSVQASNAERGIQKNKRKEYFQEFTLQGESMYMAAHGPCAYPLDRVKGL